MHIIQRLQRPKKTLLEEARKIKKEWPSNSLDKGKYQAAFKSLAWVKTTERMHDRCRAGLAVGLVGNNVVADLLCPVLLHFLDVYLLYCKRLLHLLLQRAFQPAKQNLWTPRIKTGRMKRRHAADLCGENVLHLAQQTFSETWQYNSVITLNNSTSDHW